MISNRISNKSLAEALQAISSIIIAKEVSGCKLRCNATEYVLNIAPLTRGKERRGLILSIDSKKFGYETYLPERFSIYFYNKKDLIIKEKGISIEELPIKFAGLFQLYLEEYPVE